MTWCERLESVSRHAIPKLTPVVALVLGFGSPLANGSVTLVESGMALRTLAASEPSKPYFPMFLAPSPETAITCTPVEHGRTGIWRRTSSKESIGFAATDANKAVAAQMAVINIVDRRTTRMQREEEAGMRLYENKGESQTAATRSFTYVHSLEGHGLLPVKARVDGIHQINHVPRLNLPIRKTKYDAQIRAISSPRCRKG